MNAILEIKQLGFGYKNPLTAPISLNIMEAQFITLMGENGCGKSTLIQTLLGTLKPLSGDITFSSDIEYKTGWVISEKETFPPLYKIKDVLKDLQKIYPTYNKSLVTNLKRQFELDENKHVSSLSLGEHSKLKLLKALSFEPKLLILDELTANLSPISKTVILTTLLDLFEKNKMSILYVCHSNEEAVRLSDRIYSLTKNGLEERA